MTDPAERDKDKDKDKDKVVIAAAITGICITGVLLYQYLNNWFGNLPEKLILDGVAFALIFGATNYFLDILDRIFNGSNKSLYYAGILAVVIGVPGIVYDYYFLFDKEKGIGEFSILAAMLTGILFVFLYVCISSIVLLLEFTNFAFIYVSDPIYRKNYNNDVKELTSAVIFIGSFILKIIFRISLLVRNHPIDTQTLYLFW
jgi:hypothetical protein